MPTKKNTTEHSCPACRESRMEVFFSVDLTPVFCNVLWDTREEAVSAALAPIDLAFCSTCGMIYNVAFDSAIVEYSAAYENPLEFSPRFQKYSQGLAKRLVEQYELRSKNVIEIGCGRGDFLRMLQELGKNNAVGFDPAYKSNPNSNKPYNSDLRIVGEEYAAVHSQYPADFICCRHVLEHVGNPRGFLEMLRTSIGEKEDCIIYIEVPNTLYTLKDMGIWDIIYEHCSYFVPDSLVNLLVRTGFEPLNISQEYDRQYLGIEARPARIGGCDSSKLHSVSEKTSEMIGAFAEAYRAKVTSWRDKLDEFQRERAGVVLWGAGSKGISFLTTLKVAVEHIPHIVDLNPNKQGKFVACTGQQVVAPEFLREYQPSHILVMNPIYRDEIELMARELGLESEILCV